MARPAESVSPDRRIKQKRGRKTYDALIETGFALLEHRELETISIAELARAAGYSTGAFYTRFRSKDEFFDAMIAHHLEYRTIQVSDARYREVALGAVDDIGGQK